MTTAAERANARAFVARGIEMKKRGRPRKPIYIPEGEYDFIDRPVYRREYGKSQSNPGRICRTPICREYVADKDAPCKHCGALP